MFYFYIYLAVSVGTFLGTYYGISPDRVPMRIVLSLFWPAVVFLALLLKLNIVSFKK